MYKDFRFKNDCNWFASQYSIQRLFGLSRYDKISIYIRYIYILYIYIELRTIIIPKKEVHRFRTPLCLL